VYKRRQSDNHYESSPVKAYLWLCGWILHANGFFDPKEFIPSLYFLKASNPSTVAPELVSKTEDLVFRNGFPGVDAPEITDLPDGVNLHQFPYSKGHVCGSVCSVAPSLLRRAKPSWMRVLRRVSDVPPP